MTGLVIPASRIVVNHAEFESLVRHETLLFSVEWAQVVLSVLLASASQSTAVLPSTGYGMRVVMSDLDATTGVHPTGQSGLVELLKGWLAEPPEYDQDVWGPLKESIETDRLSNRKRFDDSESDA